MSNPFGKLTKADPHSKLQAQIRKNFEQQLEQELMKGQESCESYSESSQVFTTNTFILWDGIKQHEFPKHLLNFSSVADVISYDIFLEIFNQDEIQHLYSFLPTQLNEHDKIATLKQLFNQQNFHFGSPLDQFQRKCQVGYFTKNRQKCDELDIMIANLKFRDFQIQKFKSLSYKDRKRTRKLPSSCSSVESESQKKICPTSEEDSVSTNQSQSSSAPQFIQQVPMPNMPLQFPSSTQSIFVTAPITQLPQYTSTSLLTNQMTLAYLQARKSIKKIGPSQGLNQNSKLKLESTVPTGQSDRLWLETYWKQEIDRYKNPLTAYTFSCIDGSKATVAPAAKKLLSGMSSKPRQHELLKNERPPYVTILSLVRDAAARLPKGYGTRADIMNLVKDSQFINENLPDEKMSSIISGALDRLHQSADPCVKYDQEKKIWIYLHHERDQTYPEWQQAVPQQQLKQKKK